MTNRLRLVGALTILLVLMTACFKFGGLRITKKAVANGEKNVLEFSLYPYDQGGLKDYPFLLVILPIDDTDPGEGTHSYKLAQPKVFDIKGNFGGPYSLVVDPMLRDYIIDQNPFGCFVELSSDERAVLLRTTTRINDKGMLSKQALTRVGLKYTNSDDPFEGTTVGFRVIFGGWADEGSGPDAGTPDEEEVGCGSSVATNYVAKADPGADPTSLVEQVKREAKAERDR